MRYKVKVYDINDFKEEEEEEDIDEIQVVLGAKDYDNGDEDVFFF